jgi:hypothetical protein
MAAGLPFNAGWYVGRALGLPVVLVGYLLYAVTAYSRKLKEYVKSVIRFVLSLMFSISVFLFSLVALEAAKEADYDLRLIVPVHTRQALSAASDYVFSLLTHRWAASSLEYLQDNKSFISNAIVAAMLVPLFTRGIRAFLDTLLWFICLLPNILHGFFRGFWGSFDYAVCAFSLTNHPKHPEW